MKQNNLVMLKKQRWNNLNIAQISKNIGYYIKIKWSEDKKIKLCEIN